MINTKVKSKELIKYFKYLYTSETENVGNTTIEIKKGIDFDSDLNMHECYFVQLNTYSNFRNIKIDGKFEKFMSDILLTEDLYNSFKIWNMKNEVESELYKTTTTTTKRKVKI